MRHSQQRARMMLPPLHPDNIKHPNRTPKWRLRKKWFNRYVKPFYLQKMMVPIFNGKNAFTHIGIIDARLFKNGYAEFTLATNNIYSQGIYTNLY